MRTICPPLPMALLPLLLAGCSDAGTGVGPAQASGSTAATPAAAAPTAAAGANSGAAADEDAAAAAAPPAARVVHDSNALYAFDYSYPAAAAAQVRLARLLDADLADQRSRIASEAREGRRDSKDGGFPFNPYAFTAKWQVVTELPGWLSLSADTWEFTGGAHGNSGFDSLLWDKGAGQRHAPLDLFAGKPALSSAIREPFCDALDKERAKRRGTAVDRASGDEFDSCIDPVQQVVILGSSDRAHFNRIGVLVSPYEAGPYAEGTYAITVPVTAAVLAAVKPQYRALFAAAD